MTVSHVSPTLIGLPSGSSVVKKRERTPCPMIATGRPPATWRGVYQLPLASAKLLRRKYVVSTPTSLPERRRPSRVIVEFRTISPLVVSTSGTTWRIASASAYVSPGENFLICFSSFSSSFAGPSFCSMMGVMMMLFEPRSFICSRISCSAPLPIASIAITEATPKRMPSDVRPARSLLWATASMAVRMLNRT